MQNTTDFKLQELASNQEQNNELLPDHIEIKEGIVYASTEYAAFSFYEGNRVLDNKKIDSLMQSMELKYLVAPILVNEFLKVIDGQHRFEAARLKGYPFYFLMKVGLTEADIPAYNSNASNWKFKNYAKAYITQNLADYVFLDEYCKKHSITTNQALHFLTGKKDFHGRASGGTSHKLRDKFTNDFESGKFVVDMSYDPKGIKIAQFTELRQFLWTNDKNYDKYKDNANFAKAFMTMVSHPDYLAEHMLGNLEKYWESGKVTDAMAKLGSPLGQRRINLFLNVFSDIYNFYSRLPSIDFTEKVVS